MFIVCGNRDITDLVIVDSYRMDAEDLYVSFLDGNFVEHRNITRSKITGEFKVALSGKNNMSLSQFMEIWEEATTYGYTQLTVYVTNRGRSEVIYAYCNLENEQHTKLSDGSFLDVLKITVEER